MCRIDSVDLIASPKEERAIQPPPTEGEIALLKMRPFAHQVEAAAFGLAKGRWLNLDGMGIGKTAEAILWAETLRSRGLIDRCLIICGVDSLRQNWKGEIRRFSNSPVRVLGEIVGRTGRISYATLKERAAELKAGPDAFFVVTNAASIREDAVAEAFRSSPGRWAIVVDEAHRISTKSSAQGKNLLKIRADWEAALTGTLITNSPLSAYLPLCWIGAENATLTNFKAQYCEFGGYGGYQVVGYKDLGPLNEEIHEYGLRRTFDQVKGDMPKKTVEWESVEMDERHAKFYDAIRKGVKEEADKIELNSSNLLALTTRLRQATACPSILTTEDVGSSKIARAAEICEDLLLQGEKVVVMSVFKEPVFDLAARLSEFRPIVITGEQSEDAASRGVEEFRSSKDSNLLIATHAKLGTGFSLPECRYMVCLDAPWTAAQLDQSIDRIYRITSEKPVYVRILACAGTIDERVRQIVETKRDLADYMVDGKPSAQFAEQLRSIVAEL